MPQAINLYVDTTGSQLVAGLSDTSSPPPIPWNLGDTKFFNIYLLARTATYPGPVPFTILLPAGLSLFLDIGDRNGEQSEQSFTWQYAWAVDPTGTFFQGSVSLNTQALQEILSGVPNYTAWLQLRITDAFGNAQTILQLQINLTSEVGALQALPAPPAPLTPLSVQQAAATFVPQIGSAG